MDCHLNTQASAIFLFDLLTKKGIDQYSNSYILRNNNKIN